MVGLLIVFEGVEGSGKTTQLARSRDWLVSRYGGEGLNPNPSSRLVVVTKEPGGTRLGLELRHLLLSPDSLEMNHRAELLLYGADRVQHIEEFIKPHLAQGAIILCDRYTDSTLAYQGYGRGLDLTLIHQINQIATGGLESDITLWLDVDVELGLKRARERGMMNRMEQAELAFHRRVQQGFRELAQLYPQRIVRIDGNQDEETVQLAIQTVLCQRLF